MIIKTEFLDLTTPTGIMRTHVYAPAAPAGDKTYPGLLLYPEIYQQTGPIARLSAQFADDGGPPEHSTRGRRAEAHDHPRPHLGQLALVQQAATHPRGHRQSPLGGWGAVA